MGANGQHELGPDDSDESLLAGVPTAHSGRVQAPAPNRWLSGLISPRHVGALLVVILGALILFGASWAATTASDSDVKSAVHEHEQRGEHPRLEEKLKTLEATVTGIRDEQIRQGVILNGLGQHFGIAPPAKGTAP